MTASNKCSGSYARRYVANSAIIGGNAYTNNKGETSFDGKFTCPTCKRVCRGRVKQVRGENIAVVPRHSVKLG